MVGQATASYRGMPFEPARDADSPEGVPASPAVPPQALATTRAEATHQTRLVIFMGPPFDDDRGVNIPVARRDRDA
jgi:hypothetical protein